MCYQMNTSLLKDITHRRVRYKHIKGLCKRSLFMCQQHQSFAIDQLRNRGQNWIPPSMLLWQRNFFWNKANGPSNHHTSLLWIKIFKLRDICIGFVYMWLECLAHLHLCPTRREEKMCYQMNTSLLKDITHRRVRYKHIKGLCKRSLFMCQQHQSFAIDQLRNRGQNWIPPSMLLWQRNFFWNKANGPSNHHTSLLWIKIFKLRDICIGFVCGWNVWPTVI